MPKFPDKFLHFLTNLNIPWQISKFCDHSLNQPDIDFLFTDCGQLSFDQFGTDCILLYCSLLCAQDGIWVVIMAPGSSLAKIHAHHCHFFLYTLHTSHSVMQINILYTTMYIPQCKSTTIHVCMCHKSCSKPPMSCVLLCLCLCPERIRPKRHLDHHHKNRTLVILLNMLIEQNVYRMLFSCFVWCKEFRYPLF